MADERSSGGFLRDVGFYTIAKAAPSIVGVVLLMAFTRLFPPEAYGKYVLTMTFVSFGTLLLTGWLQQSIYRYGPQNPRVVHGTVFTVLICLLSGALVVSLAGYAFLAESEYSRFYVAGTAFVVSHSVFKIFETLLRSQRQSQSVAKFLLLESVLKLCFSLSIAVLVFRSIVGWLWGGVFSVVVVALLMARYLNDELTVTFDEEMARRIVRYGVPMIGTMLCYLLISYSDRWLLELLRGTEAVGIYTSNYTIVNRGLPLVFAPLLQTIQPVLMNEWNGENRREIQRLITSHTRYVLLVGTPMTVAAILFAPKISGLVLGTEYREGASIIPFVALGVFAWNTAGVGQKGLEIEEKTTVVLLGNVLAVLANVGLNLVLIRLLGYYGAAIATAVSMACYLVYVYLVTRRYIAWRIPRHTIRNALVSGVLVLSAAQIAPFRGGSLVTTVPIAVAAVSSFYGVLYLLGEFEEDEIAKVRAKFADVLA